MDKFYKGKKRANFVVSSDYGYYGYIPWIIETYVDDSGKVYLMITLEDETILVYE